MSTPLRRERGHEENSLTKGGVDAKLDVGERGRHLGGANNGELLVELLLDGAVHGATTARLHLDGGQGVALVDGRQDARGGLGVVRHLACQGHIGCGDE